MQAIYREKEQSGNKNIAFRRFFKNKTPLGDISIRYNGTHISPQLIWIVWNFPALDRLLLQSTVCVLQISIHLQKIQELVKKEKKYSKYKKHTLTCLITHKQDTGYQYSVSCLCISKSSTVVSSWVHHAASSAFSSLYACRCPFLLTSIFLPILYHPNLAHMLCSALLTL